MMGLLAPLANWVIARVFFWNLIKWRKSTTRALAKKPGIAAQGVFRMHAAAGLFDGLAACGALVQSYSGPASDANCRACKRIIKRATKIGAGDE